MMGDTRVCVIGAGIIGLSSAVLIQSKLADAGVAAEVTLMAETFSPETTSDKSGGIWEPFLINYEQRDDIK